MLVLTRREGEVISIDGRIEVEILSIRGDKVRVGIRAPTTVAVHRKEVKDKIDAERKAAGLPVTQNAHINGIPRPVSGKVIDPYTNAKIAIPREADNR